MDVSTSVGTRRLFHWWFFLLSLVTAGVLGAHAVYAQSTECASVTIVIQQKLTLERQAFNARMTISNGLSGVSLENLSVTLNFQDRSGKPVVGTTDPNASGAAFFIQTPTLTGIPAIDGSASLAPSTGANISWLLIPAAGAGGALPTGAAYFIGATVSYTLKGEVTTVQVTPDYVVVQPQPSLQLDYFLPSQVLGSDPASNVVTPPVPFTLGVRVLNGGAGTSVNTRIDTAQPQIVDNKQGLLVAFQILQGFIQDQPAGQSLLLDFGNIASGAAQMGRWLMTASLNGHFTGFKASFSHADSLGGALTSLISSVNTHTLIGNVLVDLPGSDTVQDFLALDGDAYNVYQSSGVTSPVINQSSKAQLTPSAASYRLGFPATTGFVYVQLTDPSAGAHRPCTSLTSWKHG